MNQNRLQVDFRCPECRGAVENVSDAYQCACCKARWPIREDIPCFLTENVYWDAIPKEEMKQILEEGEEGEGSKGLAESLRKRRKELYAHTYDQRRADWRFLLKTRSKGLVLDVGCGLGALSIPLARDNLGVVSVDATHERVKFVKIRCRQEGINNLQPVLASALSLPFPDNYYDVVVLNAVLEWLGLSDEEKPPKEAQLHGLREARRVLRPGGEIYVATKNRYSYFYWLGKKDPHSGLRFVTLLPRRLARYYSKLLRDKDYREYLYSYHQYRKLLHSAGFSNIQMYSSFPSFRNFSHIFPLEEATAVQCYLDRCFDPRYRVVNLAYRLIRYLRIYAITKYFVPDFSIIASK
jgi:ubiquinone/menaquinone biosynthesis C-methylase UbiE